MPAALTSVCCLWQVGCLVLAICTMGVIQVVGIKTCRFHSGPCVCVVDSKQKLPQFAAVYNLATHQSVRMLTKKPLQANLTMSYLEQERERERKVEQIANEIIEFSFPFYVFTSAACCRQEHFMIVTALGIGLINEVQLSQSLHHPLLPRLPFSF